MARSSYIYIVFDHEDVVVAGFTVKHEMLSWIKRHPEVPVENVVRISCNEMLVTFLEDHEWMPEDEG